MSKKTKPVREFPDTEEGRARRVRSERASKAALAGAAKRAKEKAEGITEAARASVERTNRGENPLAKETAGEQVVADTVKYATDNPDAKPEAVMGERFKPSENTTPYSGQSAKDSPGIRPFKHNAKVQETVASVKDGEAAMEAEEKEDPFAAIGYSR